jgi:hypothetical protein
MSTRRTRSKLDSSTVVKLILASDDGAPGLPMSELDGEPQIVGRSMAWLSERNRINTDVQFYISSSDLIMALPDHVL